MAKMAGYAANNLEDCLSLAAKRIDQSTPGFSSNLNNY
jgi:hypothetical protein